MKGIIKCGAAAFLLILAWGCGCNETKKSLPQAPANLTATPGNDSVTLAWQASQGATGYNIYQGSPDCTSLAKVASTTATSYQVTGLINGTQYCFVVRAYNANGESADSNQATATPTVADIVFSYPNPTPSCTSCAPTGIPLKDATNVPLGIVITGMSTNSSVLPITRTTFTMTVNNGSTNIPGDIEFPDTIGQSSVLFIPARFLDPAKTYTIRARVTTPAYSTAVSFSTVTTVGSNPAVVPGQGYALHIPSGSVTQPPGVGAIVGQYLNQLNLVLAATDKQQVSVGPDTGFLQFTAGEGNTTQTGLWPGSFVLPLSGPYLGPYVHLTGSLNLNISGYIFTIDNFNISGTLTDLTAYGAPGIGITDGTLVSITICANLPADIKSIVQNFCTDTGLLILVGSFYATPFTVTSAKDINGATLAANITSPTNGSINVPAATSVWANITTTTIGQAACIAITSTSVSVTLRDIVTGSLVTGTTLTTPVSVGSVPGCTTGLNAPIVGAAFSQTTPPLVSGRMYKALTVLDLSPVTGTTFTTQ